MSLLRRVRPLASSRVVWVSLGVAGLACGRVSLGSQNLLEDDSRQGGAAGGGALAGAGTTEGAGAGFSGPSRLVVDGAGGAAPTDGDPPEVAPASVPEGESAGATGEAPSPPASDDGVSPLAAASEDDSMTGNAVDRSDGGSSPALQDGGGAGDAAPLARAEPASCVRTLPRCGRDAQASCCEALAVPAGGFELRLVTGESIPTTVSSFELDRFEVTVGRMREFVTGYDDWRGSGAPQLDAGAHPRVDGSGWQARFTPFLAATAAQLDAELRDCGGVQTPKFSTYAQGFSETVPVNCVTWFEAAAFCAWDGGRLPTFAELVYTGSGGDESRLYPWGDDPAPRPDLALFECSIDSEDAACTEDDLSSVGQRPLGAGRFGQDDLAGSLAEWVLDGAPPFPLVCDDCANLADESERLWRGGGWLDPPDLLKNDFFNAIPPSGRNLSLGFRCARD